MVPGGMDWYGKVPSGMEWSLVAWNCPGRMVWFCLEWFKRVLYGDEWTFLVMLQY